jgi:hypothetical protein
VDIQQFKDIAIGTPVIVYSFGTHYGRVTGKQPIVTIQDRTFTAETWLKVAIAAPDGTTREWNGAYEDVAINTYATDGRCHTAEPGTFGHECGKPATWIGTNAKGFACGFCDACKANGWEASSYTQWERIKRSAC